MAATILGVSDCGGVIASFLRIADRGRLHLVNRQLYDEKWGMVKEQTYGTTGLSAEEAVNSILRDARSEFGPERLASGLTPMTAFVSLGYCRESFEIHVIYEFVQKNRSLVKSWYCAEDQSYDTWKIYDDSEFESEEEEDDMEEEYNEYKEIFAFFEIINTLIWNLEAACAELRGNDTPPLDLYKYLVEVQGVLPSYLDRFGEPSSSDWYDDEDHFGYTVDQIFPRHTTLRFVPSESYKPKPLHLRQCIECKKISTKISNYECPSKYCSLRHKGKCTNCAPTSSCSTCGRKGCKCCFNKCKSCTNMMCNCGNFGGYKMCDRGGAPGCSYVVNDGDGDSDDGFHCSDGDLYCRVHKPEGAVEYVTNW